MRASAVSAAALATVIAGCGQVVATNPISSTYIAPIHTAAKRSPVQAKTRAGLTAASGPTTSSPAVDGPRFVVTRVIRTLIFDGNIFFDPPPAGTRPRVSAATAFAAARHSWGDPRGTATPQIVLMRYTNDGQGEILPGGGIRRFDVHRLVWAVIDAGATCASSGPPSSGQQRVFDDCLYIHFVDARTGRADGMMDEFGRGVPVLRFGPSSAPTPPTAR